MKKLLALLLALVMAFSMVGCSSKPAESEGAEGGETGIKDTIIWAQGTDVFSFDPNLGKETTAIQVTGNIYDTLLTVDGEMNIQPMLAKEWNRIDDLNYELILRDDVTWHDGSKFTAEDVKYSLDRAVASSSAGFLAEFIASVEVLEEYKVKMVLKFPYAPALQNLTHPALGMMSKAYAEANGEEILKTAPMGTGPFTFVEWKQGDYVKLAANENYWGGVPETKNLMMRIIPENAQRTIALEMGEIDIAYDILPNDIPKIKENAELQMLEVPSLTSFTIGINHTKPNLDNKLVREAIRLAVDSQVIVDSIYYGSADVGNSMIPPLSFGYQELPAINQDVEKAKALLVEAGLPNGFKTNIYVNDNQTRVEICQVIQSQLKAIGIECEVVVLEFATFIEKINKGEQDMCLSGWTTSTADCDYTYFAQYHSTKFGSQGNRVFKELPGMDALLEAGKAESDPTKRLAIYKQVEDILTAESVNRPLVYTKINAGVSNKVNDFVMIPNGYHKFHKVTVTK